MSKPIKPKEDEKEEDEITCDPPPPPPKCPGQAPNTFDQPNFNSPKKYNFDTGQWT
jgi:hypothetical protein